MALGSLSPMIYVVPLILLVGVGLLFAVIRFRSLSATTNQSRLFEQLGYRPVDGGMQSKAGMRSVHYVREYRGREIHFLSQMENRPGKILVMVSWFCPLSSPPGFGMQVVEADLADKSVVSRISDALDRQKYNWEALYTEAVETGDSKLDKRFASFSDQPGRARECLLNPTMRETLLALKHVDLTLSDSEARFNDPFYRNLWGLKGTALQQVHNQVADILILSAGT